MPTRGRSNLSRNCGKLGFVTASSENRRKSLTDGLAIVWGKMVKAYCLTAMFKTNSSIVSIETSPKPAANKYFFYLKQGISGFD